MYRIDENTYIDETLITCGEYQLFIDEMRGPGKYYRPDHWITHQFSKGQAHLPILGVRPMDANAFCVWLSERERGRWKYRVPTLREATDYPLKLHTQTLFGYWLDQKEIRRFTWNGLVPVNPRGLVLDFDYNLNIDPALDLNRTQDRAKRLDFDRIQTRTRAQEIIRNIEEVHGRALNRILSRADDLDRQLIRALNHDLNRAPDQTRSGIHSLDLARQRAHDLMSARDVVRVRCVGNPSAQGIIVDINRTLDIVLYIYIDILTLRERIAGRSPAFEGIRIVKERMSVPH